MNRWQFHHRQRTVAQLCTFFGLLAVFLSCIGIYGLMSYVVSRRTNEIGIRMALGAERSNVRWLVMREIMLLIGVGVAIGIPATLACGRLITKMLYGLKETDPTSLIASVVACSQSDCSQDIYPQGEPHV